MKKIRSKLFLIFLFFIASSVALGMLLNILFLERYYIHQNKLIMEDVMKEVEVEFRSHPQTISVALRRIESENGVNCSIIDRKKMIEYNAFPDKSNNKNNRLPKEAEQIKPEQGIVTVFVSSDKQNNQSPRLLMIRQLSGGELIILRKPMKGIRDSVGIANQFYLIAGLFIMFIGGTLVYGFARRITRPIIEMSEVAGAIAELNFDRKVNIRTDDELGRLGESINRTSEKLCASIDALQSDLDRRKQLVRDLSHELKTPVGVIKGYVEGLRYGVADDPKKSETYYRIIIDECDRMNRMVREMLHLSMMEFSEYQLTKTDFDGVPVIQTVMERFQEMAKEREVQLELPQNGSRMVVADKELFERCVNNYVSNAIHHASSEKKVSIHLEDRGSEIVLSVFNTGSPIAEQELQKIWDIYYRVDQARTRKYGGHGLGLSIVKKIMALHDGQALVENVPDGVQFHCVFPKS